MTTAAVAWRAASCWASGMSAARPESRSSTLTRSLTASGDSTCGPVPAAAPPPIADYALLGDCHGAALVARDGSVDWCCVPRFDAAAVFARLLDPDGGTCAVAVEGGRAAGRRYADDTLVRETTLEAADGEARVLDLMPLGGRPGELVRIAEGVRGAATVTFSVSPRLGYGEIAPFVRHRGRGVYTATGGQDGLLCHCDAGLDDTLTATATLRAGERM